MPDSRSWLTPVELILLGAIWGASFMFQRVAAPQFGPVPLVEMRLALGAIPLLPFLWQERARFKGVPLWRIAGIGLINSAIPFMLFAWPRSVHRRHRRDQQCDHGDLCATAGAGGVRREDPRTACHWYRGGFHRRRGAGQRPDRGSQRADGGIGRNFCRLSVCSGCAAGAPLSCGAAVGCAGRGDPGLWRDPDLAAGHRDLACDIADHEGLVVRSGPRACCARASPSPSSIGCSSASVRRVPRR